MQSASSWAPKLAKKCESKHRYACGADRRSVGHVITKFSGMGRLPLGGLLSWDVCCGFNNHHAIVETRPVKYSMWS